MLPHIRIINGSEVNPNTHPFIGALHTPDYFLCGASLISSYWAVTAAHCIQDFSEFYFAFKRHNLNRLSTDFCSESVRVYPLLYPDYNSQTIFDDVALLRLQYPPTCVNSVNFPRISPLTNDTNVYAAGWGKHSTNADDERVLHTAKMDVIDYETCTEIWGDFVNVDMICAGILTDTCEGDSGGPLFSNATIQKLYGITSFGETNCSDHKIPGVYVKLYSYNSWVQSYTKANQFEACQCNECVMNSWCYVIGGTKCLEATVINSFQAWRSCAMSNSSPSSPHLPFVPSTPPPHLSFFSPSTPHLLFESPVASTINVSFESSPSFPYSPLLNISDKSQPSLIEFINVHSVAIILLSVGVLSTIVSVITSWVMWRKLNFGTRNSNTNHNASPSDLFPSL